MRALLFALVLSACQSAAPPARTDATATPTRDDAAQARDWLAAQPLPPREEVVALTDRLAIESRRGKGTEASAELAWLAAELRERVWRLERSPTDAREAIELYATAAERAAGGAVGCDAELRRALLAGELSHRASETYRELYLVQERQEALGGDRSACLGRIKAALQAASAFRPTGQAWTELQRQAQRDVEAVLATAKAAESSGGAPTAASGGTDSAAPPPGASAQPLGDVVVKPDEALVKSKSVELRDVKPYSYPGGGRLVLALSGATRYEVGVLAPDASAARGHRVFIDLSNTKPKGLKSEFAADGLLRAVRLGKRDNGTRIVLDLASAAHHRVFYLPDPFRVVVDLSTREAAPAPVSDKGKRPIARVTLDPGHGGWDSGAIGPTGLREKDVALDVAHRAAPALASELGIETMLTRDTDVFVPLEERTARANAFHSDMFVSIHCNATEDGHADGIEIYMLDPTRQTDAASIRAVSRENHNAKERARGVDPKALDAEVASIAAGLGVADATNQSRTFARLLQASALASLSPYGKIADHGVKTAAFFVLLGAEMPAALFETSFISNPSDEVRLGTADYRQKLADAVVNAVRAYRDGLAAPGR